MKRGILLMGAFLLCFSLFADWDDFTLSQEFTTPDEAIGVIRLAFDSTGRLYLGRQTYVYYTDNPFSEEPDYEVLLEDDYLENGVQGLAVDEDDNVLIVGDGGTDDYAKIYKYDSEGNQQWEEELDYKVQSGVLLSTGELLVTNNDGLFALYDPEDGSEIEGLEDITGLGDVTRGIDVTPDDTIFANVSGSVYEVSGGDAENLAEYTAEPFGEADYLDASWSIRPNVAYCAENDVVISSTFEGAPSGEDSTIFVQDAETGEVLQTIDDISDEYSPGGLALIDNEDTRYLFVTGNSSYGRVYEQTVEEVIEFPDKDPVEPFEEEWSILADEYDWFRAFDDEGVTYETHSAALNPETGNVLVAAYAEDPGLKVLAADDGEFLGELNTDGNVPRTVTVMPSGKIIATVNEEAEIMVWDEEEIDGATPQVVEHDGAFAPPRVLAAVENLAGEIIVVTSDVGGTDLLKYEFDGSTWSATEEITTEYGASSIALMKDGSMIAKWVWEYAEGTEAEEDGESFVYLDAEGNVVDEVTGFFDYEYDGEDASLDNLFMSNIVITDEGNEYIAVANYTPDFSDEITWVDFPLNVHDYVGIYDLNTGEEVASGIFPDLYLHDAIQADGSVNLNIADFGDSNKFYVTTCIQRNHIAVFSSETEELEVGDWQLFDY